MPKNKEKIKNAVAKAIDCKCSLLYKQGRKRVILTDCTISAVYPEIFVITHFDTKLKKICTLSFSYIDLITQNVCISLNMEKAK